MGFDEADIVSIHYVFPLLLKLVPTDPIIVESTNEINLSQRVNTMLCGGESNVVVLLDNPQRINPLTI